MWVVRRVYVIGHRTSRELKYIGKRENQIMARCQWAPGNRNSYLSIYRVKRLFTGCPTGGNFKEAVHRQHELTKTNLTTHITATTALNANCSGPVSIPSLHGEYKHAGMNRLLVIVYPQEPAFTILSTRYIIRTRAQQLWIEWQVAVQL
jgi:hypothetical protein